MALCARLGRETDKVQIPEDPKLANPSPSSSGKMAEETGKSLQPPFPSARVKKIVKLDKDINKLTSEALLLISSSTELFLQFLAEQSSELVREKKRKTVKLEDIRSAVKRHRPTSDFLLDSLPQTEPDPPRPSKPQPRSRATCDVPASSSVRRIDSFFCKPKITVSENENEASEQPELLPTVLQTDNFSHEPEITASEKENEESEQPELLAQPTILQPDSFINEPEIPAAEKEIEKSELPE